MSLGLQLVRGIFNKCIKITPIKKENIKEEELLDTSNGFEFGLANVESRFDFVGLLLPLLFLSFFTIIFILSISAVNESDLWNNGHKQQLNFPCGIIGTNSKKKSNNNDKNLPPSFFGIVSLSPSWYQLLIYCCSLIIKIKIRGFRRGRMGFLLRCKSLHNLSRISY